MDVIVYSWFHNPPPLTNKILTSKQLNGIMIIIDSWQSVKKKGNAVGKRFLSQFLIHLVNPSNDFLLVAEGGNGTRKHRSPVVATRRSCNRDESNI